MAKKIKIIKKKRNAIRVSDIPDAIFEKITKESKATRLTMGNVVLNELEQLEKYK